MAEIRKYQLEITDEQTISVAQDTDILCVGEQNGQLVLWARTDPSWDRQVRRRILIRGTGHAIEPHPYIGTVIMTSGLVWHVFDGGDGDGDYGRGGQ